MNIPKVNILLATYNGSKHLKKQLDSLIAQTYPNINIYIRDDVSTDNTLDIINEYIKNNSSNKNIILLDNKGINLRPPRSFYQILTECDNADYYAFCDQDDIWHPDKIKWAVEELEKKRDLQKPLVYFSSYDYYTDDGTFIRHSPIQKEHISLNDVLYYTPASGFLLVFNNMARQQFFLDVDPGTEMHDRWLLRCCACFGDTIYDHRCSAYHIRHAEAVTSEDSGTINLLKGFVQKELLGSASIEAKKHLQYFYKTFSNQFTTNQNHVLHLFTRKNSFFTQLKKLFYPHSLRARIPGEIALRILFLLGRA